MEHRFTDEMRALLQRKDPRVQQLDVHFGRQSDFDPFNKLGRVECENDGIIIGSCTTLKRLKLAHLNQPSRDEEIVAGFEAAFRGIAKNRSIEELYVDGYGPAPLASHHPDMHDRRAPDMFLILSPLFEHNRNLRRLHLQFAGPMFPKGNEQLCAAIEKCSSLTDVEFNAGYYSEEYGGGFIAALTSSKSNLTKLSLRGCLHNWNGCSDLEDLIRYSLEELDLTENDIDDEGGALLGRALGNTRLKALLFRPMMQDEFREEIEGSITLAGWRALFACLESPDCALEELDIEQCDSDDKALALADGLVGNTSLTTLTLTACLSPEGWCSFFSRLFGPRPSSSLELLDFLACEIDRDDFGAEIDPGIARRLANALESSVKTLVFNEGSLSAAMSSNHTAKWLLLGEIVRDEGEMRHALGTQLDLRGSQNFDMGVISSWLSDDLVALLDMNAANDDKTKVVCEKVRFYYNTCNPNVEDDELLLRELRNDSADLQWNKVMPFVMAWAGGGDNPTLLYRIIRRVPTLFGSDGGISATRKRKATS